jgi:hypothetical protein
MKIKWQLLLQVARFLRSLQTPKTLQDSNKCSINQCMIKDFQPKNDNRRTSIIRTITVRELMSLHKTVVTEEPQQQSPKKISNLT